MSVVNPPKVEVSIGTSFNELHLLDRANLLKVGFMGMLASLII